PSEILAADWSNLAGVYARTGRLTQALALYREAYALDSQLDGNNPNLFFILAGTASVEGALGDYAAAVSSIESAIQRAEAGGPEDTLQIRDALLAEAAWLHKLKRERDAKRIRAKAQRVAETVSRNGYSRYTVDARQLEKTIVGPPK
ncbi:MAG TPA: tetratricopeptide repeat protein, partial [Bryobacteraceae bacterium]|nr:tetratricopeptide repeat protein [Bryobacteraceae bacterium]